MLTDAGDSGPGFGLDLDAVDLPARREALVALSRPVTGVHDRAKRLPPALVAQAFANEPFEDHPRTVWAYRRLCETGGEAKERFENSYRQGTASFLRRIFPSLTLIPGISFEIGQVAKRPERRAFDKALARYRAADLEGQAGQLTEAFDGLRALRMLFGSSTGPGDCCRLETIVPARYLPELLVAAPVWFIEAKGQPVREGRGAHNPAVRYFCDLGRTDQFAYLFQLYNNRPRSFAEFSGPDIMPLPLVRLVGQVKGLFDYLVIATPYHDLAAAEWGNSFWERHTDPFLFGFIKQVPELMFCLGRWSGTGLFPLIGEMMADTLDHLRQNRQLLAAAGSGSFSWYKTDDRYSVEEAVIGPRLKPLADYKSPKAAFPRARRERERWKQENHTLVRFAGQLLERFEKGSLFAWLRGEGP